MPSAFVIAEAGVNHNGSLDLALALVDRAAEAGADAVKFQTFKASSLTTKSAPKAGYQDRTVGTSSTQQEMIRRLQIDDDAHRRLFDHAKTRGIEFMSTPFDHESLAFLVSLGVRRLKLSSGDLTNLPLLRAAGRTGLPTILSTGMGTLAEVEGALGGIASGALGGTLSPEAAWQSAEGRAYVTAKVALLHCTTEYPAPLAEVNLRVMDTLAAAFALPVGYSDHTTGIVIPIAAAARGATIVEKHFTLDRSLEGPDHAASLEPGELTQMVRAIRDVELALGDTRKVPSAGEARNILPARRSLVAKVAIRKGEPFTDANVVAKRPGNGVSPMLVDAFLGRPADRDYAEDELLDGVTTR